MATNGRKLCSLQGAKGKWNGRLCSWYHLRWTFKCQTWKTETLGELVQHKKEWKSIHFLVSWITQMAYPYGSWWQTSIPPPYETQIILDLILKDAVQRSLLDLSTFSFCRSMIQEEGYMFWFSVLTCTFSWAPTSLWQKPYVQKHLLFRLRVFLNPESALVKVWTPSQWNVSLLDEYRTGRSLRCHTGQRMNWKTAVACCS